MPRFNATARRLVVLNRLELEAVQEARLVLSERKPARRVDQYHGWMRVAPIADYIPAGKAAATVLEVYVGRIQHVEQGRTNQ